MRLLSFVVVGACASAPASPTPPRPVKSQQLDAPGAPVALDAHLVAGYVTVVDFWGEHCGACTVVGGMLAVGVAVDDRVLIRKIDVGDGFTQVAKDYNIGALPHYRVYDKQKRLRYDLVGNDCLQAAKIARELADE
ncbi:MAG TPA: thioredoxin family protein [Kofleriaceae bacterium]|nr:thioredoxin family protein [Kofleriaceae bacterium]